MLKKTRQFNKGDNFYYLVFAFNVLELYNDSHFLSRNIIWRVLADSLYHFKFSLINYYIMMKYFKIITLLLLWNNDNFCYEKQVAVYTSCTFKSREREVSRAVGEAHHGSKQPLEMMFLTQSSPPQIFKSVIS